MGDRIGRNHQEHGGVVVTNLSELIAPLCATQAAGQTFFCIPDRPSLANVREISNTIVVTMIKGRIEDKFTRILLGVWRWTARRMTDQQFTVRFPNAQLINDWGRFNPIKMRSTKAKIQIDSWNGSVGAKAELHQGWFRVRGIPYDKRSEETVAYAGSLVGGTVSVDKSSLSRMDYVRIKLAVRDLEKVPTTAEGAIIPFLYDFSYEREVELVQNLDEDASMVRVDKEE
jgi:hypothetical protein